MEVHVDHRLSTVAPGQSERDDTLLIDAARHGNQEAFRQLYLRHVEPCYWLAHSILRNEQDAEDTVQDTFFTCYKKLNSIEIFGESLLPWLLVTTKFLALNRARARKRRHEVTGTELPELHATDSSLSEQLEYQQALAAITAAVSLLSEIDQQIFQACIVEEKSYDEVAQQLGVSQGAVRNRLFRIRKNIRAGFGDSTSAAGK